MPIELLCGTQIDSEFLLVLGSVSSGAECVIAFAQTSERVSLRIGAVSGRTHIYINYPIIRLLESLRNLSNGTFQHVGGGIATKGKRERHKDGARAQV